jgi:hypothetical protein
MIKLEKLPFDFSLEVGGRWTVDFPVPTFDFPIDNMMTYNYNRDNIELEHK